MGSLFARMSAWFTLPGHETKQSATGRLLALQNPGQPVWTPRDYAALAREGYQSNPVAYRCVRMIAEAAASVPWVVYEDRKRLDEHPLLEILVRPNPVTSGPELFESWYGYLQIAGNSYMEAVTLNTELRELYVLRPDRMKVVPGPEGWPAAYEYSVAGSTVRFSQEPEMGIAPVYHMALFHPLSDHYGMSPFEAAAYAVDIHNAAAAWNKALLDNSARPSGALVYEGSGGSGNLTREQFERLKAELEGTYQGAANAGRPMLLEGGLDWKSMGYSPREMDFIATKHAAARDIALSFGVPPMLLGIPGDNSYANFAEANRAFWRQSVLPLVNKTARALTNWLAPAYGSALRLTYDREQIDALAGERASRWRQLGKAGFLTRDEKRVAAGYPPLDDTGDGPA